MKPPSLGCFSLSKSSSPFAGLMETAFGFKRSSSSGNSTDNKGVGVGMSWKMSLPHYKGRWTRAPKFVDLVVTIEPPAPSPPPRNGNASTHRRIDASTHRRIDASTHRRIDSPGIDCPPHQVPPEQRSLLPPPVTVSREPDAPFARVF